MQPTERKAAKAKGLKQYFTGEPCREGHVAARWTVNGRCVDCATEYLAEWRISNYGSHKTKKAAAKYMRKFYLANRRPAAKKGRA